MPKLYAVIDHVCEADILVAVFSLKSSAKKWIKAHKNDPYSVQSTCNRYESLDIEECELDPK